MTDRPYTEDDIGKLGDFLHDQDTIMIGDVLLRDDCAVIAELLLQRLAEDGRLRPAAGSGDRFVILHTDEHGTVSTLGSVVYGNRAEAEHRAAERRRTALEYDWHDRFEVCRLEPVEGEATR